VTTVFKAALGVCGLSQQEAADFLGVALPTIKDWCRGSFAPPTGVWQMLAGLYDQIDNAAQSALDTLEIENFDRRAMNDVAIMSTGEKLPTDGAQAAAAAIFLLTRLHDPLR